MERMNEIVAGNIRRLREERGLTMEELARLSGVSRSMLAQVERGEGNPTLSTLWKLSNGMKVPFHALTMSPKAPYEVVRPADLQPILEDGGRVKNYSIFPDGLDNLDLLPGRKGLATNTKILNGILSVLGKFRCLLSVYRRLACGCCATAGSRRISLRILGTLHGRPCASACRCGVGLSAFLRLFCGCLRGNSGVFRGLRRCGVSFNPIRRRLCRRLC